MANFDMVDGLSRTRHGRAALRRRDGVMVRTTLVTLDDRRACSDHLSDAVAFASLAACCWRQGTDRLFLFDL
jgi:hypothetical protein